MRMIGVKKSLVKENIFRTSGSVFSNLGIMEYWDVAGHFLSPLFHHSIF